MSMEPWKCQLMASLAKRTASCSPNPDRRKCQCNQSEASTPNASRIHSLRLRGARGVTGSVMVFGSGLPGVGAERVQLEAVADAARGRGSSQKPEHRATLTRQKDMRDAVTGDDFAAL